MNYVNSTIVTVRNSSSRLPNKAIKLIKNDLRSIDIVIKRAKLTNFPVILATSTDKSDDIFVKVAKEHEIEIFRGSLLNKIKRWHDCFEKYQITNGLLLDGDDLCHNYQIGKRVMSKLIDSDSEIIINPKNIITGFFTYAITKKGLDKIYQIAHDEKTNTDVITRFIEKATLKSGTIELMDYECNKNIRLTLDYEEDLVFFRKLYEHLDVTEDSENVINFLKNNKNISEINFKRQKDFLENQLKFNEKIK